MKKSAKVIIKYDLNLLDSQFLFKVGLFYTF